MNPSRTPLRIAIVGCGHHAAVQHAAPLARYASCHPDAVHLVAACDLDASRAERLCATYGFQTPYTDLDTMVNAAAPDGVVAVMPLPAVASVGSHLLRRGVPCTIEKPLGTSQQETAALLQAARETRTPHMVSVNRRYAPFLKEALRRAESWGPVRLVRGIMLRRGRAEDGFGRETGIHIVDAVRFLGGAVATTEIRVHRLRDRAPWFNLSLRFASGAVGEVGIYPTTGMSEETYELLGEEYRAVVSIPLSDTAAGARLSIWSGNRLVHHEEPDANEPAYMYNGAYDEVGAFVDLLRFGHPPKATVEDVAASEAICWQLLEEARAHVHH